MKQDFGKDRKPQADTPAELGEKTLVALPGDSKLPSNGGLPTTQQTVKAASADVSLQQPSLGKVCPNAITRSIWGDTPHFQARLSCGSLCG